LPEILEALPKNGFHAVSQLSVALLYVRKDLLLLLVQRLALGCEHGLRRRAHCHLVPATLPPLLSVRDCTSLGLHFSEEGCSLEGLLVDCCFVRWLRVRREDVVEAGGEVAGDIQRLLMTKVYHRAAQVALVALLALAAGLRDGAGLERLMLRKKAVGVADAELVAVCVVHPYVGGPPRVLLQWLHLSLAALGGLRIVQQCLVMRDSVGEVLAHFEGGRVRRQRLVSCLKHLVCV